jgi:hypothetical protein
MSPSVGWIACSVSRADRTHPNLILYKRRGANTREKFRAARWSKPAAAGRASGGGGAPAKQHVVNARTDGVLSAINFEPSITAACVPHASAPALPLHAIDPTVSCSALIIMLL